MVKGLQTLYPDFISLIVQLYQQHKQTCRETEVADEYETADKDPYASLVAFAADYLSKNQPAQVTYLGSGLGVKLMDGTIVAITPRQKPHIMRDSGLPVFPDAIIHERHKRGMQPAIGDTEVMPVFPT